MSLYTRLALTNIKNNRQTYLPYMLTSIGSIAMFFNMISLAQNPDVMDAPAGSSVKLMLMFGTIVIGLFCSIFLFYTNSFLVKRRKKEFGLLNILGMGKRHLLRLVFQESLIVSGINIGAGILAGVLLSKLLYLILFRVIRYKINFGFSLDFKSILITVAMFAAIFFASFLTTVRTVSISSPVELLRGGNVGEKEPKTKWLLAIIGVVSLGIGYFISLNVKTPLNSLPMFFVAVLFVMVGTYATFTAGSIAFIKMLRNWKSFYYKSNHFTNVSGMLYRMKQNAVGLANICILSTAVLVTLSTTVSMFIGMDGMLKQIYPYEMEIYTFQADHEARDRILECVDSFIEEKEVAVENRIELASVSLTGYMGGNQFTTDSVGDSSTNYCSICIFTQDDYNHCTGNDVSLADDEVLFSQVAGSFKEDDVHIADYLYDIVGDVDYMTIFRDDRTVVDTYVCVVKDDEQLLKMLELDDLEGGPYTTETAPFQYEISFDYVDLTEEEQLAFSEELDDALLVTESGAWVNSREGSRSEFFAIYGSLFFIGIFLGLLFLMATVMIIYYKQLSEGYEDKERFHILQSVGMDKGEVKKTILNQVLIVFFLPLATACVHITFAYPVIVKLLALLNLTDTALFIRCLLGTIVVFAMLYALVYAITSRTYYRIVEK